MTESLESYAETIAHRCEVGSVREIRELMTADKFWQCEPLIEDIVEVLEALAAIGKIEELRPDVLC